MNPKLLFCAAAAVLAAAGAAVTLAGRAVAASGRPRLDFVQGDFAVAMLKSGRATPSYYLPYKLTNPMDEARTPRLHIEVRTDTGKTYGDFADPRVTAIAERDLRTTGLKPTSALRSQELAAGASVQALANFGNIDPNADDLTVRVYGLWDPIVRTKQGKVFRENRVLVLSFARQGDEYDRPMDPIRFVSRKEVVEGDLVELYSTAPEKK